MLPHEDDLEGLKEYLIALERIGVTAIIAASPYIMMTAKRYAPNWKFMSVPNIPLQTLAVLIIGRIKEWIVWFWHVNVA